MLGETYEIVTNKFRFINEKIEHQPKQINVWALDGIGYKAWGNNYAKSSFRINGGRGLIAIEQEGVTDIYFEKYDEHISLQKPIIHAKNIIFGGLFIDAHGEIKAINNKTKETMTVKFIEK